MKTIEELVWEGWEKVRGRLAKDPGEVEARVGRMRGATMRRPMRAWCLAVRAADTRITAWDAAIVPEHGPGKLEGHRVTVDSRLLRKVCRPVWLTPPGEPAVDVARKLGVMYVHLQYPRFKGVFETHYVPGIAGRGKPVPLLYTKWPLDPGAQMFGGGDALWVAAADGLVARIPGGISQTIERVARFVDRNRRRRVPEEMVSENRKSWALPKPPPDYVWYKWKDGVYVGDAVEQRLAAKRQKGREYAKAHPKPSRGGGSKMFRGWMWVCPGCKKKVRALFYPLYARPAMELAEEMRRELRGMGNRRFEIGDMRSEIGGRGLEIGGFRPGEESLAAAPCFACWDCHKVFAWSRTHATAAWNHLVCQLSGGLLYGREVERPEGFGAKRKRAYRPQTQREAPRRQQVLRRVMNGWTMERIARDMGVQKATVQRYLWEVCRQEGVKDGEGLKRKLGGGKANEERETMNDEISGQWAVGGGGNDEGGTMNDELVRGGVRRHS